jgi:hypothetical protein
MKAIIQDDKRKIIDIGNRVVIELYADFKIIEVSEINSTLKRKIRFKDAEAMAVEWEKLLTEYGE